MCRRLHPLRVISNNWLCHVCKIPAEPVELASLAHSMESKPTLSSLCISSFGKYGLQDCTGAEYDDEVLTKDTNGNVNTVDELLSDRFNNQIETPFLGISMRA